MTDPIAINGINPDGVTLEIQAYYSRFEPESHSGATGDLDACITPVSVQIREGASLDEARELLQHVLEGLTEHYEAFHSPRVVHAFNPAPTPF